MRKYDLFVFAAVAILGLSVLACTASAQYWFQSGARGSNDAAFNNGASVSIQTVYQNATTGSLGFWVGESLSNGAFIQVGYEIPNASGLYTASCNNSVSDVYLKAGTPTWFWEYFRPNDKTNSFCGGIGANGSVGRNGSFNTYSFKNYQNTVWYAYFNGQKIGSVDLGASNSGPNPPSAFAEYAQTSTNQFPVKTVYFRNLAYYIENLSRPVATGYSAISYGKGSLTSLPNPYGVREVGNFTDYFAVGSNFSVQGTPNQLWRLGYSINVVSAYGNATGSGNYVAYSMVPISVPRAVGVGQGAREVFTGWIGTGLDAYTGNNTNLYVTLYGNTTETATWKRQYYLNVTTAYGNVTGGGWYDANSTIIVHLRQNYVGIRPGSRFAFEGWSNGDTANKTSLYMDTPENIGALWGRQYYLGVKTPYGRASGSGWYNANSAVNISLDTMIVPINGSARLAFSGWSNGNLSQSARVFVNAPTAVNATFGKQYLVTFVPEDSGGRNISGVRYYGISGQTANSSSVFVFANRTYNIEYIYYKNVTIATNYRFETNSPERVAFKTPVYDIAIQTQSVFGTPVNASLNITFDNGTKLSLYSGGQGSLNLVDVPYGHVSGYADYLGFRESINTANGNNSYLTFFTASVVAYIIAGIALIVAISVIVAYLERKRGGPGASQDKFRQKDGKG